MDKPQDLQAAAEKTRHRATVATFCSANGPNAATPEDGEAAWDELKKQIKIRISPTVATAPKSAACASACHGPTMLVYPERNLVHA